MNKRLFHLIHLQNFPGKSVGFYLVSVTNREKEPILTHQTKPVSVLDDAYILVGKIHLKFAFFFLENVCFKMFIHLR